MCCFSRPIEHVSRTSIFARRTRPGWQALAYSMTIKSREPVAMVLPIPVANGATEASLRFVDLSGYASLFQDLEALFPPPPASRGMTRARAPATVIPQALKVEMVGSFVASFAPARADLAHLDPRFRLPERAWKSLPQEYSRYGFAVFQLKEGHQHVHPMAFEFASAEPKRLFFPTIHVHDGKVHENAEFDHTLYCQAPGTLGGEALDWVEGAHLPGEKVDARKAQGLVVPLERCYRARLYGHQPNVDTWAA